MRVVPVSESSALSDAVAAAARLPFLSAAVQTLAEQVRYSPCSIE